MQLLLDYFHVVSLQKVLLLRAHPLQLGQQVGEEHASHRLVVHRCVPKSRQSDTFRRFRATKPVKNKEVALPPTTDLQGLE